MTVTVYTDASFSKEHGISTCGILMLSAGKILRHDVFILSGIFGIHNAEIWAVTYGLQEAFLIQNVSKILVFTDHKAIITRVKQKSKYKELDETLQIINEFGIAVEINHVYAHKGNKYNNMVDKSCNSALKDYVCKLR